MKRITVLMDLQLSSLENGKFLITPDSNVNVALFTIKNMLLKFPGKYFFILLVPRRSSIKDGKSFQELATDSFFKELNTDITYLEHDYFKNPFVDRMTFSSFSLDDEFYKEEMRRVDVVYTNDPCKVLSYKTYFYYLLNKMIPVISRNHWVSGKLDRKVPEEIDFFMRQVEGANVGNSMSFNSKFAVDFFLENCKEYFNEDFIDSLVKKLKYFDTVDARKVDSFANNGRFEKFTILWAHRLSYYTGWKETLDALLKLWSRRQDFQVIVPDPGNKMTQEKLKEEYPFIKKVNKEEWTHEKYLETCWKCDVVLGNHKYPATWGGLAITEPMVALTCPILPKRHSYPEMFYDRKDCFFVDEDDMIKKIEKFMDDPATLIVRKAEARKFCLLNLSMRSFVEKIDNQISECFQS